MNLYCELCSVQVPSEQSMKAHLDGKKHRRLVQLRDHRAEEAEKSIYVRGLPVGTLEFALTDYFMRFGPVAKVFLEKKGNFAIVEFTSSEARNSVLRQHLAPFQGQRLIVKPKQVQLFSKRRHEERKQAMQDFTLHGNETTQNMEQIMKLICAEETVADQVECLMRELELTEDDVKLRQLVCSLVQEVFSEFFPGVTVHQFGSSANLFGTRGCDMDIFLDFNEDTQIKPSPPLQAKTSKPLPYTGDIKSLQGKQGLITRERLLDIPLLDKMKILSGILVECVKGVNHTFTIPSARCPVIRFIHETSGLKCDLSVNNRLALCNTNLLRLYANYDLRVRLLVFIIRYWAKHKELAGNVSAGPRLNNYALTMMVMFYLQNTQTPSVPTLDELRKYCDNSEVTNIGGWDCSFPELNKIPPSQNTLKIDELLTGFFKFYSEFDFRSFVICPKSGSAIPIADFIDENVSDDQSQMFKIGPVNIQDPFVLTHNMASNVNEKTLLTICKELHSALFLCTLDKFKTKYSADNIWGVAVLLDKSSQTQMDLQSPVFHESDNCPVQLDTNKSLYECTIVLQPEKLSQSFLCKSKNSSVSLQDFWCDHVMHFVRDVLSEVLMFQITDKLKANKKVKDVSAETHDNDYMNKTVLPSGGICIKPDNVTSGEKSEVASFLQEKCTESSKLTTCHNKSRCETDINVTGIGKLSHSYEEHGKKVMKLDSKETKIEKEPINSLQTSKSCSNNVDLNHIVNDSAEQRVDMEMALGGIKISPGTTLQHATDTLSTNAVTNMTLKCMTEFRSWVGRKKIHKALVQQGLNNSIEIEKHVSAEIKKHSASEKCSLTFDVEMQHVITKSTTVVCMRFKPSQNEKEFSCLVNFLKAFIPKMINNFVI